MNRYTAIGNLTRDPELHQMGESERQACDMRVAISNGPDRPPTYIDVSTFDGSARACAQYLSKGSKVAIDGRLITREWQADDGTKRSKHSVLGRVEFLDRKQDSNGASSPQNGTSAAAPEPVAQGGGSDDEIPF